jgi:hypothetical protein
MQCSPCEVAWRSLELRSGEGGGTCSATNSTGGVVWGCVKPLGRLVDGGRVGRQELAVGASMADDVVSLRVGQWAAFIVGRLPVFTTKGCARHNTSVRRRTSVGALSRGHMQWTAGQLGAGTTRYWTGRCGTRS